MRWRFALALQASRAVRTWRVGRRTAPATYSSAPICQNVSLFLFGGERPLGKTTVGGRRHRTGLRADIGSREMRALQTHSPCTYPSWASRPSPDAEAWPGTHRGLSAPPLNQPRLPVTHGSWQRNNFNHSWHTAQVLTAPLHQPAVLASSLFSFSSFLFLSDVRPIHLCQSADQRHSVIQPV